MMKHPSVLLFLDKSFNCDKEDPMEKMPAIECFNTFGTLKDREFYKTEHRWGLGERTRERSSTVDPMYYRSTYGFMYLSVIKYINRLLGKRYVKTT